MANMNAGGVDDSPRLQDAFTSYLLMISGFLAKFLAQNKLIRTLDYRPDEFWPSLSRQVVRICRRRRGEHRVARRGAGRDSGRLLRCPSGSAGEDREEFSVEVSVIDDLYDPQGGLHDENDFEDKTKMRDAARIIAETAGCLALVRRRSDIGIALMHGPLINPVAPYGTPGFPRYRPEAARKLAQVDSFANDDDRHFVELYRRILNSLAGSGCARGRRRRAGWRRPAGASRDISTECSNRRPSLRPSQPRSRKL